MAIKGVKIPDLNFSGGSGGGSDSADILQQLSQEELNALITKVPNQIIDAFNDDSKGTKVNLAASADALRFNAGQDAGTYTRDRLASAPVSKATGVAVMTLQALAPKNIAVASNTFVFSGDVTEFFPTTKKVLIARKTTSDGQTVHRFLADTDTNIAQLVVSSRTYNSGTDETSVVLTNTNALDLDLDVSSSNYNAELRLIPFDYQFESKALTAASLEQMAIIDAFCEDVVRLAGENFAKEVGNVAPTILEKDAVMSPNKQYGIYRMMENTATHRTVEWFYTADRGKTWTSLGTRSTSDSLGYGFESADVYRFRNRSQIVVADNGKMFSTYTRQGAGGNAVVYGVYADISAGSPVLNDVPAIANQGVWHGNNGAGVIANSGSTALTATVGADLTDLSFIAVLCQYSGAASAGVAWYSNGGATALGNSPAADFELNAGGSAKVDIVGTAPNRRTWIGGRKSTTSQLKFYGWDEGSYGSLVYDLAPLTNHDLLDTRYSSTLNKLWFITHADSGGSMIYEIVNAATGSPSTASGTQRTVLNASSIQMDTRYGCMNDTNTDNFMKGYNTFLKMDPANHNHLLAVFSATSPDAYFRSYMLEVEDASDYKGVQLSKYVTLESNPTTLGPQGSFSTTAIRVARVTSGFSTHRLKSFGALVYQSFLYPSGTMLQGKLYNTSGGLPTTVVATSVNQIDASKITTDGNGQWIYFNFDDAALDSLTGTFALVIEFVSGSLPTSGGLVWRSQATGGTLYYYNGSSWVAWNESGQHRDPMFEVHGEWITDVGLGGEAQGVSHNGVANNCVEPSIEFIDSNQLQLLFRRNACGTSVRGYDLSGHIFRRVVSLNSNAKATISAAKIAGYAETNFDPNLVLNIAIGDTSAARINTTTGALNADERSADMSGIHFASNNENVTSADYVTDADFQLGFAVDLDGSSESWNGSTNSPLHHRIDNTRSFIIEAEIKPNDPTYTNYSNIVSNYDKSVDRGWTFQIRQGNGHLFFYMNNSGTNRIVEANEAEPQGYHKVRVVYNAVANTIKLYRTTAAPHTAFTEVSSYVTQQTPNATFPNAGDAGLRIGRIGGSASSDYFKGKIGYVKMAKFNPGVAPSFVYDGFKAQPAMITPQNLGIAIAAKKVTGEVDATNNTYSYYETMHIDGNSNQAAVVDSYDIITQFQHSLAQAGSELQLKISMNRGSSRNQSSIQGINFRFSK